MYNYSLFWTVLKIPEEGWTFGDGTDLSLYFQLLFSQLNEVAEEIVDDYDCEIAILYFGHEWYN
ncbi:hypothetical protein [Caldicellulosiruptor naganoensis]|uniref:Uncharacterized protein n=1 Tax=Caldicellulosiruptor naganoensis TaxID=29324 RepID=A0ABY7BIC6_9FIRM|nr:hypothetical protein [Caldicellulosiruptor naganoensis]WAM31622.1 hypothetical protein OTJ99_000048 [Caldicellulosiruptor naganoensis]